MQSVPKSDADAPFRFVLPEGLSAAQRSRVIATLGHDLRQPLHSLSLALQALALRGGDADFTEMVQLAGAAHSELSEQLEHLLALIAMGSPHVPVSRKPIDLGPLLESIGQAAQCLATKNGIEVRIAPSRIRVDGDEIAVRRVVTNLVNNAIRHSMGRHVLVGARPSSDGGVVIEVLDDGRQFDQSSLQSMLTAPPGASSGVGRVPPSGRLGLYSASVQAALLGGTLSVRANRSKGLRFRLAWPGRVEWIAPPVRVDLSENRTPTWQKRVVVVLDDHPSVLNATRKLFRQMGATVMAFRDEYEMMESLLTLDVAPDLLLLDYKIGPNRDITPILQVLRSRFSGQPTLIALMTGHHAAPALRRLAEEILVLAKPLTNEALLQIERRLGRPSLSSASEG